MRLALLIAAFLGFTVTAGATPFRYAKVTAKLNRQYIDLSGLEPVMKLEEICTGELEIPVQDFVNPPGDRVSPDVNEVSCMSAYLNKRGSLNVGASMHIRQDERKGLLKSITGWVYFLPDEFLGVNPPDYSTLPHHTGSVATNALDLEYIQMSLWTGGPQVCAYDGDKPICMLGNTFLVSIEINDSRIDLGDDLKVNPDVKGSRGQ